MIVYSYYERLDPMDGAEGLTELFKESWSKHGWEPVILTRDHAAAHPQYAQYLVAIQNIPSANGPGFDTVCFIRYLAMLRQVGGLMVDLDVINYGLTPQMLPGGRDYCLQQGSGTFGSQYFYGWLCYEFCHWQTTRVPPWTVNGQPHWSDMVFLSALVPHIGVCLTHMQGGWEKMPLIHYSNGSLYRPEEMTDRRDRADRIRAIRPV